MLQIHRLWRAWKCEHNDRDQDMHGRRAAGYGALALIVTFGCQVNGRDFDILITSDGFLGVGFTLLADISGAEATGDNPSNPLT